MAIYHLSAKVIQRSHGRSAVAAAAYRAAAALHDENAGRTFNYLAKPGVVHSEILLPAGAPERWRNRAALWNEVERIERRCDAVLAREIALALPRELSQAEAIRLARDFAHAQFVTRGMVADLNVHYGQAVDGTPQPHAHVMLSMRRVVAGSDGHPEEGAFGLKERAWNDKRLLRSWRVAWADLINERLAGAGIDMRVDHRSNAARGIDLEPQHKIGPAGARRAARGEDAERADEHRAIARRNGERMLVDPSLALVVLTQQQSTFTRRDLARVVSRHSDDAEQFASIMAKVGALPELVRVGQDPTGHARFSTREMVAAERRMEAAALDLSRRTTHGVAIERRRVLLATSALGDEQKLALGHVTRARDLSVVVGYAGTGKGTMLGVARQAWAAQGYSVRGAALSGIAADGLEAGAGIASRTIASWEHAWAQGKEQLTAHDVLVVDEAGMVGSRQMDRVLAAVQRAGAKLVLVGDHEQLQAIEAGAAFRAIVERVGAVELTEVRRQLTLWQRDATRELATGRTREALGRYTRAGMVYVHATDAAAEAATVAGWQAGRQRAPGDSRIMLAHTRDSVRRMNDRARKLRREAGELGDDHVLPTERGARAFAVGDRIYFLRNERGLGVKNGTLGTITAIAGEGGAARLTVRLDRADQTTRKAAVVAFALADYAHIDHGYAATVHKAQGVTIDRAHVMATPGMDRHLAYVALSRHRHGIALHWSKESFASDKGLADRLGRERAKDTTLDYGDSEAELCAAYAERRGLQPTPAGADVANAAGQPAPDLTALPAEVRARAAADPGLARRNLGRAHTGPVLHQALTTLQELVALQPTMTAALGTAVQRMAQRRVAQDTVFTLGEPLLDSLLASMRPNEAPGRSLPGDKRQQNATPRTGFDPMFEAVIAVEQTRREVERPLPGLPGTPFRAVTKEEIDAVLAADGEFLRKQHSVREWLNLIYRDPAEVQGRLDALAQRMGGIPAAIAELQRQGPDLLGKLKGGEGLFASPDAHTQRHLARQAAEGLGTSLAELDAIRSKVAYGFELKEELRRKVEAIDVPGLSKRVMQAAAALRAAGAVAGWRGPAPWKPLQPSAADIVLAARVAPVWDRIKADAALYDEVQRFMEAARQRLPERYSSPAAQDGTQIDTVQAMSSLLHAASELHRAHPELQDYAAAEPGRRAEAMRQAEQAAQRRAEDKRIAVERHAAEKAEIEALLEKLRANAPRRRQAPSPSSRPGGGPTMG